MFALFSALAELEIACEQDFLALNKQDFSADVENTGFKSNSALFRKIFDF